MTELEMLVSQMKSLGYTLEQVEWYLWTCRVINFSVAKRIYEEGRDE